MACRPHHAPTDDWQQLELSFIDAIQHRYALIRPVVLFGVSPSERAAQTGAVERTLYRHVQRFAEGGMAKLFPTSPAAPPPRLTPELCTFVADVKAEYSPLHLRELQTRCYVWLGRCPNRQTIKRILADTQLASPRTRRYPPFHAMGPHGAPGGDHSLARGGLECQVDCDVFRNESTDRAYHAQAVGS